MNHGICIPPAPGMVVLGSDWEHRLWDNCSELWETILELKRTVPSRVSKTGKWEGEEKAFEFHLLYDFMKYFSINVWLRMVGMDETAPEFITIFSSVSQEKGWRATTSPVDNFRHVWHQRFLLRIWEGAHFSSYSCNHTTAHALCQETTWSWRENVRGIYNQNQHLYSRPCIFLDDSSLILFPTSGSLLHVTINCRLDS